MSQPTTMQRKMFAKLGLAMPDGSFYIRNGTVGASDLENAIKAVGRGESDGTSGNAIRKHIMKRAAALKLSAKIPDTWQADGSLKHEDPIDVDDFLEHFGVRGMKWGVRRHGGGSDHPASDDGARARATKDTIKKHGLAAVSNADLQHLVDRQRLENKLAGKSDDAVSAGKKAAQDFAVQFAKKQAADLVSEFAPKGATFLAGEVTKLVLGTHAGAGKH